MLIAFFVMLIGLVTRTRSSDDTSIILKKIEDRWIIPILKNHDKTIKGYNRVFALYNRKIERLENMFIELGHGDLLEELCRRDLLTDENSKKAPPKPGCKLTLVKTKE